LFESADPAELASESAEGSLPPSTTPGTRARESLVQALFSHTDFVTVR
jgi:hypothetical protein